MKIKINFFVYTLLLFFMFMGHKLFNPLVVIGLIYLVSNRLFYKKLNIDFDFVLLLIFAIFYPLRLLSDMEVTLTALDFQEWKTYVVILLIGFLSVDIKDNLKMEKLTPLNNFIGSNFSFSIISFTLISLYYTFPSIYRFPDYSPVAQHMISPYFGFLCLLATSLVRNFLTKIILLVLCLVAGGGASTIGVAIYVTFYFLLNKNINLRKKFVIFIITTILSTLIFIPLFIYSQDQRGRDITAYRNLDRYISFDYGQRYIRDNFNGFDLIFGRGADENIDLQNYLEQFSLTRAERIIGDYIVAETDEISGKNFHNDLLRIFLKYGIFGLFIFIRFTYNIFSYNISFYISFLVISFSNSIATISFSASLLLVVFIIRNMTLILKNYKKYI